MAAEKKKTKKKILVIVESPSKAKTIGKFLGSNYKVTASVGHVRDLPKSKLGIDIDNNFEPQYISIRGKGDLIKALKKEAKDASKIYLATDPDREGEAISWHLAYILGIDPASPCRIVFNEITKKAIKEAVKNPRPIDLNLVDAQQARRVLDRLVGYQISPLLWRKIRRGLSAGRVQSAALKIICDREKEINAFVPEEYWNITAEFKKGRKFSAKLVQYQGGKVEIPNEETAQKMLAEIEAGKYTISKIEEKETTLDNIMKFDKQIKGVADLGKHKRFSKKVELEPQEYEDLVNYAKKGIVADKEIYERDTKIENLRNTLNKWIEKYDGLVEKTKDYFHAIKLAPQRVADFFKSLFDKEKQDELERQRIEQEKLEAERKAREEAREKERLERQKLKNSPEYKKRRASYER